MQPAFIAYQNRTVRQRRRARKQQAAATLFMSFVALLFVFFVLVSAIEAVIGATP